MEFVHFAAGIVGAIHLVFALVEAFFWGLATKKLTTFGHDPRIVAATKPLGQNFAIYNLLVGVGLFATYWLNEAVQADVQVWVLSSIAIAGGVAGLTLKGWLLPVLQGVVPALSAVLLLVG